MNIRSQAKALRRQFIRNVGVLAAFVPFFRLVWHHWPSVGEAVLMVIATTVQDNLMGWWWQGHQIMVTGRGGAAGSEKR